MSVRSMTGVAGLRGIRGIAACVGAIAAAALPANSLSASSLWGVSPQNPLVPTTQGPGTQNPNPQNPLAPELQGTGQGAASQLPNAANGLLTGNGLGGQQQEPDEFQSIWSVPSAPKFSGFPTFPARLPGYGNYPLPVNQATGASPGGTAANNPFVLPLAPAEPEPSGWPTWIRAQAKKPLPFAPDLGLLISQDGRIWHRDADDQPFEPVLGYEKFASLPVGASVETRGAATFEVLLHESTRVQARGLTALKVTSLDEQTVHLTFTELSWLRLSASGRTNRFTLPDGSTIEFAAKQPPPPDLISIFSGGASPLGTPGGPDLPREPSIEIRRMDEPGWYGGRATMTNFGGSDVVWTHAFGKTVIEPDHRVILFLTPPAHPTSAGLQPGATRIDRGEESVTCTSDTATEVQWCGAKIQLPGGAKVTFESLGGAFVEKSPVGAKPEAGEGSGAPAGTSAAPNATGTTPSGTTPNGTKPPTGG